jgi:hypothetical protein
VCLALAAIHSNDPDVRAVQTLVRGAHWRIAICYVPGHMEIEGNEKADRAAKLPTTLAGPSDNRPEPAAVKLALHRQFRAAWRKQWSRSTKGRPLRAISTTPLGQVGRLHKTLGRDLSSLLTQLRTGHLATTAYLYRRRLSATPTCPCHHGVPETMRHILLSCPRWRSRRRLLQHQLGATAATSSRHVLNHPNAVRHAVAFFAHRFRQPGRRPPQRQPP